MREIYIKLANAHKNMADIYYKLANDEKSEVDEKSSYEENNISIEEIREILAKKSQGGKTEEIKSLLKKYNAKKLSNVKKEDYRDLLLDAKEL